jgi:hypothetical protein
MALVAHLRVQHDRAGLVCVPLRAAPSRDVVLRLRQGVARFEFAWTLAQQR